MTTPLIFFGSDRYSAVVLERLIQYSRIKIQGVVTDQQSEGSPVEKLAIAHNIKVAYYPNFDHALITKNTLGLCASFDHLIPSDLIAKFGGHLYNLHPSLLPQYRNVSPVQYAIALGDQTTGITLFRIAPTIDDGEIIAQAEETILPEDTTATLTPRLFAKGADLFLDFLQGSVPCRVVENYKVRNLVFTRRLKRESGYIEWSVLHQLLQNKEVAVGESTNELLNLRLSRSPTIDHRPSTILHALVRALTPWPTIWSTVPSKKGELRVTLESVHPEIRLKISGKPNAILYNDFIKYYL